MSDEGARTGTAPAAAPVTPATSEPPAADERSRVAPSGVKVRWGAQASRFPRWASAPLLSAIFSPNSTIRLQSQLSRMLCDLELRCSIPHLIMATVLLSIVAEQRCG